jgi:hypothetical protein
MIRVGLIALLLAVRPSPVKASEQKAGGLQGRVDAQVESYTLSQPDLARALIAVSSEFKIPVGIEWIEPRSSQPIKLKWEHTTVGAIIQSLATVQPGYELEVGDAIVHIFYSGARADPSNFLNIEIPEFDLQHTYVGLARLRLEQVVAARVTPPPPPGAPISMGGSVALDPHDRRQNFRFVDAKVREVLDTLTLAGEYKIWVATFPEGPALTPTGFRPTLSLWAPQAGPNELPAWDLFDWNHSPPSPPKAGAVARK